MTDKLIEWLKTQGFDKQEVFKKLKEDEYDMNSFHLVSDNDLKEMCPAKGPLLLLKKCRDEMNQVSQLPDQNPPPNVPTPDPVVQPKSADPPHKEGKDTAEYIAFRDVSISLTETIESTPGARDALFQRFTQKEWISFTATPSANELVVLARNKIKQRASEYETVLKILKEVDGMDIVIERMKGIRKSNATPAVSQVASKTGQATTVAPLAAAAATVMATPVGTQHPVFDEVPGLGELGLMEWTENGTEKELRLIKMIANKWKDLGVDGFGMEGAELDNQEGSRLEDSCRNVLQKFLRSGSARTGRPTWQSLIKALKRAELTVAADKLQHALPLWYEGRAKN